MNKIFSLILFIFTSTILMSQTIQNGSFELADSNGILTGWKINNGVIKRSTAQFHFGYPFIATDQVFFISIENDTVSTPIKTGKISNTFALIASPTTLSFDAFYFPNFNVERYSIEILFSKWQNNQHDTILYQKNLLKAITDSNNLLTINWAQKKLDLRYSYRDTITKPDTAQIIISNDAVPPFSNSTYLLLDNFQFSNIKAAINELSLRDAIHIYPIPTADKLNISLNEPDHFNYIVYDLFGKEIENGSAKQQTQLNVSEYKNGIYFVRIFSENGKHFTAKFIVTK